jgi:hypothetical protein
MVASLSVESRLREVDDPKAELMWGSPIMLEP